jgi:hypothetical protein
MFRATFLVATAILLAGCSAAVRFSGAVNGAKQAGRPIVIYAIRSHHSGSRLYPEPISLGVDFVNTASQPLRSVTFYFRPYRNSQPLSQTAKKGLTAKGPFAPNHAYRFHRPKSDNQKLWPNIEGQYGCPVLVGVIVKKADGGVIHIGTSDITRYLTPNVTTACVPAPGTH